MKSNPALIALGGNFVSYDFNTLENKILFGLEDGFLLLFDIEKSSMRRESAMKVGYQLILLTIQEQGANVLHIRWHPKGDIICVTGDAAVFFFDCNLKPLSIVTSTWNSNQIFSIDLTNHLRQDSVSPI